MHSSFAFSRSCRYELKFVKITSFHNERSELVPNVSFLENVDIVSVADLHKKIRLAPPPVLRQNVPESHEIKDNFVSNPLPRWIPEAHLFTFTILGIYDNQNVNSPQLC